VRRYAVVFIYASPSGRDVSLHNSEDLFMNRTLNIVTDGSAIGNPGPGGWGAVFTCGQKKWKLSGASHYTTAAEMELTAAIEALQSIEPGSHVILSSDCDYLIRGMRYQAMRWKRWGWRNSRGMPLQDRVLWQGLLELNARHFVRWRWIRGHTGHPAQTEADALAYFEARRQCHLLRTAA
jgi:ribonuclease HI